MRSGEDRESGQMRKEPRPVVITILALEPDPEKTPWWTRKAKLDYSHIVLAIGNVIWDQPWKGTACAYDALVWVLDHGVKERESSPPSWLARGFHRVDVSLDDHDPWAFLAACKKIEGRRSQRWRTILRFLHLWPVPAWNCTSPVREIMRALDPEHPLHGETPDAIIKELTAPD